VSKYSIHCRKNKDKVTHVLVYLLDRFSRSGDDAMRLSKELREKYGVTIVAVTQLIDTSNPGGGISVKPAIPVQSV
jgi:site-specific DNA recombinase